MTETTSKSEMPKWKKPSQRMVEMFDHMVIPYPAIEKKIMFGFPCGFINGNMVCGIFEEQLFLRLPERDRAEFRVVEKAQTFAPQGREMKEYMVVPPYLLDEPDTLEEWLVKSVQYGLSLPAKASK